MQKKQNPEESHLLRLCFCNPHISFTLQRRVMESWKPVMEIMTVLFNEAWKTATSDSKECSECLNLDKQHGSEKEGV